MRWQHPEFGLLEPGGFIDIAEETGLIALIDRFTLEEACRQLRLWSSDTHAPRTISVNMSARDLRDAGIVERVRATISHAGIDPTALCIEITESTTLFTGEGAVRALFALRDLGCQLALDDFGTGYSSLAAVRRLPINVVKIDRSFVERVAVDAQDAAVVAAVMSLAQALELNVVAEGVEAPEQARVLLDLGCRRRLLYVHEHRVEHHAGDTQRRADAEGDQSLARQRVLRVHEPADRQQLFHNPVFDVLVNRAQRRGEFVDGLIRDHVAEVQQALGRRGSDVARVERHAEVHTAREERGTPDPEQGLSGNVEVRR